MTATIRYSECVDAISRGPHIGGSAASQNDEEQQEPLLYIRPSSISLNQSGIIDSLAAQIFLANGSVLASDVTGDREECRN